MKGGSAQRVRVKRFLFAKQVCRGCAHYAECVRDKRRPGRFVTLHPQEQQLQQARALEQTDYFRQQYRQRVVVEHRIARLLQLLLAASVANLTLVAGRLATRGSQRDLSVGEEGPFTGFWDSSALRCGADAAPAVIVGLLRAFGAPNAWTSSRPPGLFLSPVASLAPA